MRESAQAALSCVRAHARSLQPELPDDFFQTHDFHVHVPAGAIPKDGPRAGVAMATALASLIAGRPVRDDTAMTGELTLTGQVLPIGGLKEKALAAQAAGHQARDRAQAQPAGHRRHPGAPAQGPRVHLRRPDRAGARAGADAGDVRTERRKAAADRKAPDGRRRARRHREAQGSGSGEGPPLAASAARRLRERAPGFDPAHRFEQPRRMADRADLGDVALERQADRPVHHRAHLARDAGNLAHVVGAGQPPGGEPAEA